MKLFTIAVFMLSVLQAMSQEKDFAVISFPKAFTVSGYLEFYAAVDDDDNDKHQRPYFLYHNTRTGELALNLGFLKASWKTGNMRGNIALMKGTYPERNLATESEIFRHVYEANVGIKVSKKRNLWLDLGILNSHIGLESAIGKDNPTLTRSIAAENSPYYETGAKLSYQNPNEKWTLAFLVLNGWQRIYKLDGNYLPAAGMQLNYKPSDKLQLNYSNYIGDESPEEDYAPRIFHDFFFVYAPIKKLSLQGAFDLGTQPDVMDDDWPTQLWYGWFGIVKWNFTKKFSTALRVEQYNDPDEVMVRNAYGVGFVTMGYSVNFDYLIQDNALLRLEGRRFEGQTETFETREGELKTTYDGITASLAVSF